MPINTTPCATCRNLQSGTHTGAPTIRQSDIVQRGGAPFFVCPTCEKLYAVKDIGEGAATQYAIVSSASHSRQYRWMVEGADGTQQHVKGAMTEEEARRKYTNPVKVSGTPVSGPRAGLDS